LSKDQTLDLSGVGAHHQNGVAERTIRTITSLARAMMLHMAFHWPEETNLQLWPYALQHAAFVWNHLPNKTSRISPVEIFSSTNNPTGEILQRCRVWGCPVYVLSPELQDGRKIPKWHPRARRGMFLGFSTMHSSTVGLVLNLKTGHISPQYHVVYDKLFTTVSTAALREESTPDLVFQQTIWVDLILSRYERNDFFDDLSQASEPLPILDEDWLSPSELDARQYLRELRRTRLKQSSEKSSATTPEISILERGEVLGRCDTPNVFQTSKQARKTPGMDTPLTDEIWIPPTPRRETPEQDPNLVTVEETTPTVLRRGTRVKTQNPNYFDTNKWTNYQSGSLSTSKQRVPSSVLNSIFLQTLKWESHWTAINSSDLLCFLGRVDCYIDYENDTVEEWHPLALQVRANAEDNPSWDEAMNGPDQAGYWKAMEMELSTLEIDKNSWTVVDKEDWMNVLPSTWAFKCKRFPDGTVRKLKAIFCVRGDRQKEGVDYFDTFAPVVSWHTVRLMLVLSVILNLATKQVDYTAAFVHAPIDIPPNYNDMSEDEKQRTGVFVNMPRGFTQARKVLKLQKSLYGLKQAPRNFFMFLKEKLENIGFRSQQDLDPCLFISDRVICLVYVDDTLFYSPKESWIDEVIQQLRTNGMDLEVEGEVAGFLGVHISRNDIQGSIELKQVGLIQRIIEAVGVMHLPIKRTPAASTPLVKDDNGENINGTFNYSSVVGMLQYLQNHTRPDITFAVSQCARYVHFPKLSHENAVIRICQYLRGTAEKGLIFKPTGRLSVDCYVDADFAGLWPHEDKQNPDCVKSRTGYVTKVAGCPAFWGSRLQGTIALSTMEAEYTALSIAMRELLPFKDLVGTVGRTVGFSEDEVTTMKTTVWEDNVGALTLANLEPGRNTPHSKH
jgi:hypothetical protein